MKLRIKGQQPLQGTVRVPADKSMTHRGLMFAALAEGRSVVTARAAGEDNLSTMKVLQGLGVTITRQGDAFEIGGLGPRGLKAPKGPLDCGNSGTTMRLMSGILAGAGVRAELTGDASLSGRPMGRVCRPLRQLGARLQGKNADGRELPPLQIEGGGVRAGEVTLELASAQVKSCLILAGLCAGEAVTVREPSLSRDHTERMLSAMGAPLVTRTLQGGAIEIRLAAGGTLSPRDVEVPGDFSSAAFLMAAGALVPGSKLSVDHVGVNATRTGLLEIFEEYGAKVSVSGWREAGGEPVGTLQVESGPLRAVRPGDRPTEVFGAVIPRLIDELVVLAAVASQAEGVTEVRDAKELRVKESDRVKETLRLLAAFGVRGEERDDGYVVRGPQPLEAAKVDVSSDHRIALTGAVLALAAPGESELTGFDVAAVSYPDFVETLRTLGARVEVA